MLKHKKEFVIIFVFVFAFVSYLPTAALAVNYFCLENVIVGGALWGESSMDSVPGGLSLNSCLNLCQSNNADGCSWGQGSTDPNNPDKQCASLHGNNLYVHNYPEPVPVPYPYNNIPFTGWSYARPQASPCSGSSSEPTGSPIISNITPSSAFFGQSVEISGTNLSNKISLVSSSGQIIEIIDGWVDSSLTTASFDIPLDIQLGSYKIKITNTKGEITSSQSLTIKTGGDPFSPPKPVLAPLTQGLLPTNLGQLIQQIFTWSLALLGIAVFVMFFYAGFLWLTAAGNTANVEEARKRMTNAVLGAVLLLSSYLILNTINPDFVQSTVNLPGLGKKTVTNPPPDNSGGYCSDTGNTSEDYGEGVAIAMDEVIEINPNGIADKINTVENQMEFLGYVADELKANGYEATVSVLNGNGFPNRGDLIAIWVSGDSLMERYDVIASGGEGDRPLRNATAVQFVGDIPLDCTY